MTPKIYTLDVHYTYTYKWPRYLNDVEFKVTTEAYNDRYLPVIHWCKDIELIKADDYVELAGGYFLVKSIETLRAYDEFDDCVYNAYDLILENADREVVNNLFNGKLQ